MMGRSEMRQWGPPPRGRGKGKRVPGIAQTGGITPAWAGKSWLIKAVRLLSRDHPRMGGKRQPRRPSSRDRRDHPRVGGEKAQADRPDHAGLGSPPRGRGKAVSFEENAPVKRITPAWAGKRLRIGAKVLKERDHPCVGGEKISAAIPLQW